MSAVAAEPVEAPQPPRVFLVPALPQPSVLPAGAMAGAPAAELERRRDALAAPLAFPGERAIPATDPGAIGSAIVLAAVEALHGARPVAQLARWLTPEVLAPFGRRVALTIESKGRHASRAALRRVRVCRLGDFAAEVTIVVQDRDRVRAVALRLEAHRGLWRAVALEIG